MIAVITSGSGFGGTEKYIEDKDARNNKEVRELGNNGIDIRIRPDGSIDADPDRIARSFRWQAQFNSGVSMPVGHTSLSFHPKDSDRMTDSLMIKIALEYMKGMGIKNTQWHIVRHCEKAHPHCHIVWNRVDCDGKKINDRFEKRRSTKVCRELTIKYGLTWGEHKSISKCKINDPVEQERYFISRAVKAAIPRCYEIDDLQHELIKHGIITDIRRNPSGKPTGISFSHNGHRFKGSDIDRSMSIGNIMKQLNKIDVIKEMTEYQRENNKQDEPKQQHSSSIHLSLADFFPESSGPSMGKDQKDETDLAKEERIARQHL